MPNSLEFHPLSQNFPLLSESELADLAADIETKGLKEPLWIYQGKILDGRNRYLACQKLGIEPTIQQYGGKDPLGFVVSMNLYRRHLTYDQRVGYAVQLREEYAKQAKLRQLSRLKQYSGTVTRQSGERLGESAGQAAETLKVSKSAVEEVIAEEKQTPGTIQSLILGKSTVRSIRAKRRKRKKP